MASHPGALTSAQDPAVQESGLQELLAPAQAALAERTGLQTGPGEAESSAGPTGLAKRLIENLPADVAESLSERQRDALIESADRLSWSRHPADIRLSFPLFAKRYYLVFLAGEERRSQARRAAERRRYPISKLGNFLLLTLFSICSTFVGGFLFTLILIWYLSL